MQYVAIAWLVYRITDSVAMLGLIGFAGQIPIFILSPFTGALIDRWSRHKVLIITQIILMIMAFMLVYLFYTSSIEIWQIFVISIVSGITHSFDIPARQSFVIDMVENKEDLGNAIALNSLLFNGAMLIGPSIAGILLASSGEGICFLVNGISYFFIISSLVLMKVKPAKVLKSKKNILKDIKEGISYVFDCIPMRYIILLLALANLLAVPYTVLLPAFAKDILAGGSNIYGFLVGASGFGALLGALYLASMKTPEKTGKLIPWSAIIFGLGLIIFSFSRYNIFSIIIIGAVGFGDMLHTAASNTFIQTITDDDKRGRVMSLYTMAIVGTAPFGSLLIGELADLIGIPNTLMIGGAACITGAFIFIKKVPYLRILSTPDGYVGTTSELKTDNRIIN
jgi:MFS family permease